MAEEKEGEKKKGPKGAVKHQPGRGHDPKSALQKKKRFAKKAAAKRKAQQEVARNQWEEWDRIPDEAKKLLGPAAEPQVPRPRDVD
jgi:hypothetical protein